MATFPDGLLRVRLLALVQGVRDFARRTGHDAGRIELSGTPVPVPALKSAFDWALRLDVARATDPEALAVRAASALADPGSPGADARGPAQVRAILTRVAGPETGFSAPAGAKHVRYLPLAPLGSYGSETLFPVDALDDAVRRRCATSLWEGFVADHGRLPVRSLEAYLDSLAAALQKHAWCVPSGPGSGSNDVSIADHTRVTGAIAACLWHEAQAGALDLAALAAANGRAGTRHLALIGGDVSGVQKFLYTIVAQRALRGLRGRSFYLQLVAEAVVRHLCTGLSLPATNVLFEGGGHFYLLAPWSSVATLGEGVREVAEVLLRHHQADLSVAVAHVPLSPTDLTSGAALTRAWSELGRDLSVAKGRKGGALAPETLVRDLFTPRPSEGEAHHYCTICQGRISDLPPGDPADYADEFATCALCHGMEDLGGRLRLGSSLIAWEDGGEGRDDSSGGRSQRWRQVLRDLGMDALVVGDRRHGGDEVDVPLGARVTVARLTDADLAAARDVARRYGYADAALGFRLVAQATPLTVDAKARDGRRVAELSELACRGVGVARLGFLRADVDNLGTIIRDGLTTGGKDGGTLARRLALSYALRLFFEGHLGTRCGARNPVARAGSGVETSGVDRLYLIYSGGDDLFLTGAWDTVAETARDIAKALQDYVGENPAVHLSAGLAVVDDKYPVRAAAEDAGEALDTAKGREGKNAVALFDRTLAWPDFTQALDLAGKFGLHRAVGEAPRQVLRLALRLTAMEARARADRNLPDTQLAWGQWMWQGAYALARSRAPADLLKRLEEHLTSSTGMATLHVGATWADLAQRGHGRD